MLKKTILSIGVAVALVGFAAPSVASADIWTLDGVPVGESTAEGVTFDGTGEISGTRNIPGLGKVQMGPCVVHVHGTVWNSPTTETGHGEVDEFDNTVPCDISLNGVKICTITNRFSENFPWTMKVKAGTAIAIYGVNFTNVFSANCPLGPGAATYGTATGQWSNESSSISYNESGDVKTPEGGEAPLDGSIGITPVAGGTLALE